MKTLLVALNSKYIHSNLALWYLKACCGDTHGEIKVMEFTINDSPERILGVLYREKPDVVAFSCYIWNVEYVLKLSSNLKKVLSPVKVILGGPELSFDSPGLMGENPWVDFILSGEGEESFRKLLGKLQAAAVEMGGIAGLTYRDRGEIITTGPASLICSLDDIPSPYTEEMLNSTAGRILYYEASRGCPFSCSYCISSTFEGVRYFSLERVRRDLSVLMASGAKQVKFVDRTFNCNKERAKDIIKFILSAGSEKNYHFEAAADLFDDEMLDLLSLAPAGLFQLEIGVQTTNESTLEAVSRVTRMEVVFKNIKKLMGMGNMHIHLDLIAGLPGEDFDSFKKSFNRVYALQPHNVQLGFLKLLKGSRIREERKIYGYKFRDYPPYEILENNRLTFEEILELKSVEELVERYYNSGRFSRTLSFVIKNFFPTAYAFYQALMGHWEKKGCYERSISARGLYDVLAEFIEGTADENVREKVNELLKLDFLSTDNSNNLPDKVKRRLEPNFKEECFGFLKNEENIRRYLPEYAGIPAKQVYKQVHFESFNYDVTEGGLEKTRTIVLFDYGQRDKVAGFYRFVKVEL